MRSRGTSTSRSRPAGVRRVGGPAPGRGFRPGVPPASTRPRQSTCRAAWATTSRRSGTAPRTRTSSTHWSLEEETYTFVNLADGAGHPVADPAGGVQYSRPTCTTRCSRDAQAHGPAPHDGHRLQRPARPRHRAYVEEHGLEAFRVQRHRHLRLLRPGPSTSGSTGAVRHDHQRRRVHRRGRQGRTPEGASVAWKARPQGARPCSPGSPASTTSPLVHVSSDYVFDGTAEEHDEEEAFAPLGVYPGRPRPRVTCRGERATHYILRSSWVIGEAITSSNHDGPVRRVADAQDGLNEVTVVAGRPVRPPDLHPRHGRGDLPPARLRRTVRHVRPDRFGRGEKLGGHRPRIRADQRHNGDKVLRPISTAGTSPNAKGPVSPRPTHSALSLAKIEGTGYHAPDWEGNPPRRRLPRAWQVKRGTLETTRGFQRFAC